MYKESRDGDGSIEWYFRQSCVPRWSELYGNSIEYESCAISIDSRPMFIGNLRLFFSLRMKEIALHNDDDDRVLSSKSD